MAANVASVQSLQIKFGWWICRTAELMRLRHRVCVITSILWVFFPFSITFDFLNQTMVYMVNLRLLDGKMELNEDIENIQKTWGNWTYKPEWVASGWNLCKWKFRYRSYSGFDCYPAKHLVCLKVPILGKKHKKNVVNILFLKEQPALTHHCISV